MHELAKGSTMKSTLAYVTRELGEAAAADVLARMDRRDAARVEAVAPVDEVPYGLLVRLWEAVDVVARSRIPDWAERSGASSIDSVGMQLYAGIVRKPTPRDFLTQGVSLFQLYYHPGDMEVVEEGTGRAVTRLVGFDPRTPIFCRRQVGGLARALELAGGRDAAARHVRCSLEGDAFCEWELTWTPDTPRPGSAPPSGA